MNSIVGVAIKSRRRQLIGVFGSIFVIAFMILLVFSAIQLSIGHAGFSENIAEYSFYSLVIGMTFSCIGYREGQKASEKNQTSYSRTFN